MSGVQPAAAEPLARCRDVTLAYGPRVVLRDVSFEVGRGQRVGLLGPNGGGKTTLVRALTGELQPAAGEVQAARCAVVPQTDRSRLDFPVSALDVALMGAVSQLSWWRRPGRAHRAAARAALDRVGLAEHADATFGALSGGQRQRVLVARALVQDAPLLALDEPFAGVDAQSTEVLMALVDELAAEGRALIIATHDAEQARRWDLVLRAEGGQVAFGAPNEVLAEGAHDHPPLTDGARAH